MIIVSIRSCSTERIGRVKDVSGVGYCLTERHQTSDWFILLIQEEPLNEGERKQRGDELTWRDRAGKQSLWKNILYKAVESELQQDSAAGPSEALLRADGG